jgi:hypothetical protein
MTRYLVVTHFVKHAKFKSHRYRHVVLVRHAYGHDEIIQTWRYLYVGKSGHCGFAKAFREAERSRASEHGRRGLTCTTQSVLACSST